MSDTQWPTTFVLGPDTVVVLKHLARLLLCPDLATLSFILSLFHRGGAGVQEPDNVQRSASQDSARTRKRQGGVACLSLDSLPLSRALVQGLDSGSLKVYFWLFQGIKLFVGKKWGLTSALTPTGLSHAGQDAEKMSWGRIRPAHSG